MALLVGAVRTHTYMNIKFVHQIVNHPEKRFHRSLRLPKGVR